MFLERNEAATCTDVRPNDKIAVSEESTIIFVLNYVLWEETSRRAIDEEVSGHEIDLQMS